MSLPERFDYDCVVMGAGPAGCTAAALVAQAGYRTLLLERERFPRFHVGESLMPETYWTFERLGVLDEMRRHGFVPKVGVQFVNQTGRESQPFFFNEHDPRPCSTTWHVERDRFDKMMFDNAARLGAECHDGTRVTSVDLADEGDHSVHVQLSPGETATVKTQIVVDATGQSALIGNRLGLIQENRRLRKASIWTYYEGAERSPDPDSNTTTILHTSDKKAWFWYIPLSGDIVSVGVVSDNDYLLKGRGAPEQVFHEELAKCSNLADRVREARGSGKYHVAREFSYTTRQHAGRGWVLIGDAFGFIDPIYSSGVFLALKSGEDAADAIIDGLQRGDLSGAQLGRWTDNYERGAEWIRKLVHAFYTEEFSFGSFMKQFPQYQGNLTDLLIGRVFGDDVGRIFDDLDPAIAQVNSG